MGVHITSISPCNHATASDFSLLFEEGSSLPVLTHPLRQNESESDGKSVTVSQFSLPRSPLFEIDGNFLSFVCEWRLWCETKSVSSHLCPGIHFAVCRVKIREGNERFSSGKFSIKFSFPSALLVRITLNEDIRNVCRLFNRKKWKTFQKIVNWMKQFLGNFHSF